VDGDAGALRGCRLVVSALGARPKLMGLDKLVSGRALDEGLIAEVAQKAKQSCRPLTNLATDTEWRRAMVAVLVTKALRRLG
jgi:4-hydroxybenzoyl-CoA reductase subunit beta